MPPAVTCWSCGNTSEQIHFCDSCHSLQPPTTDYFEFFGLPRRFHLDTAELERRYYALSRRLHPDVYFRRSAREQQFSLDATAILNDGYRTLKDTYARAEYLLAAEGLARAESVPAELMEEVFEWNMELEEAGPEESAEVKRKFARMLEDAGTEIEAACAAYDGSPSPEALKRVRVLLDRRRYLHKLAGSQ